MGLTEYKKKRKFDKTPEPGPKKKSTRSGRMFVADFKKHNVWVIERGETTPRVYFHSDRFNQPNDLAIAADGTLYASDPRFASPSGGQIWRITRGADGKGQGEVMSSTRRLGVTNGLDLSPDGATLYVSESNSRQVWAYRLDGSKLLDPRLVRGFADFEVDGLRSELAAVGAGARLAAAGDAQRCAATLACGTGAARRPRRGHPDPDVRWPRRDRRRG